MDSRHSVTLRDSAIYRLREGVVRYEEVLDLTDRQTGKEHKIRHTIYLDGYTRQCYGKTERWDGAAWHEITQIPGSALVADPQLGHLLGVGQGGPDRGIQVSVFQYDITALTRKTLAVLL